MIRRLLLPIILILLQNRIADTTFYTPTAAVSNWTRFSLPFNYHGTTANPAYIMINATASANQTTTTTGSQFWIDDISVVYNTGAGINEINKNQNLKVYYSDKTVYIDFLTRSNEQSTLSIFDLTGKLVSSQTIEKQQIKLH